jgi:hypothetical protein
MARRHERIERWELPDDNDRWQSIRAADAYLRVRVGLNAKYRAAVFDKRGHIFENDLIKAYKEWQKDPSTLKSVLLQYGDSGDPLDVQLHAKDLDRSADESFLKPTIEVTVKGADAAEVHGLAQESIHKAKQAPVVPKVEVPQANLATPPAHAAVMPHLTDHIARQPSRLSAAMNHPYAVQIVGGLIATLLATFLILWLA